MAGITSGARSITVLCLRIISIFTILRFLIPHILVVILLHVFAWLRSRDWTFSTVFFSPIEKFLYLMTRRLKLRPTPQSLMNMLASYLIIGLKHLTLMYKLSRKVTSGFTGYEVPATCWFWIAERSARLTSRGTLIVTF